MRKNNKQSKVVKAICRWYKLQGRTLPWRGVSDPYRILISEIMLQQTQVSRVLVKYPEFLYSFPTLRSLANAKQRDVVLAWRGMGYNNRAVRLHKFAQQVVREYRGKIPADFDSLLRLPGIGKYTANALLSSAFGRHLPIVDVNVQRVLSRIFWRMKSTTEIRSNNEIWKLAEAIIQLPVIARRSLPKPRFPGFRSIAGFMRAEQSRLVADERLLRGVYPAESGARNDKSRGNAYDWNQALMDLGALVCTANNPKCVDCPVVKFCASRKQMKHERRRHSKNEPSLAGIPNRIYRGRIIEHLRKRNSVTFNLLGNAIHSEFSFRHESWLKKLVDGLATDQLVTVKHNGSLQTSRISLA